MSRGGACYWAFRSAYLQRMFLLLLSTQLNDGFDFCNFALLLVSASTCLNFCAEHFETQKLPPEGHLSYYSIMTMVSERIYLEICEIFCAPMVPYVAGRGLNLCKFSWRSFQYAILSTRGLGKIVRVQK